MSPLDCRSNLNDIFTPLYQKFPDIPARLVVSVIFHDFSAPDLYTLTLKSGDNGDWATPFGQIYDEECSMAAVAWSREPNLLFRHLCTYFSILSAYFNGRPTVPLGFFQYLDHLQHLSGMHEWTPVYGYHVEFFNNRVEEMRQGDFSKWAVPEASLMKKYGFDRKLFLPEPNQYSTNCIFYNGKLWRLVNDPTRGQISFILRRTRDPFADEIQFVAYIKVTTDRLHMFDMPVGKPGEKFYAMKDPPGRRHLCKNYDLTLIRQHLSYEGGDLPFLTVVELLDSYRASDEHKKKQEAKIVAEKARRRSQRIEHLKSLLPQAMATSIARFSRRLNREV